MATGGNRARLLEADPELGAGLAPEQLEAAVRAIVVPLRRLEPGAWEPPQEIPVAGHLGFLVLGGLLGHETAISRGRGMELLCGGDLLRPWQEDAASFGDSRWRVLETALLAELEPAAAERICRLPPLVDALLERMVRRCRSLAAQAAIQSIAGLDDRLLALFWHLAERGGRRTDGGVAVPLRLTHQALAELAGARRPSVTVALHRLAAEGRLRRSADGGWLLSGAPPPLPAPPRG